MFDNEMIMFAAMGMGAISVGVIMYLLLDSLLSGSQKVEKRKKALAGGNAHKKELRDGNVEARRRQQVSETMKEIEEKSKKREKVTMRLRLQRAGLETLSIKSFYMFSAIVGVILALVLVIVGAPIYLAPLGLFVGAVGLPRYVLNYLTKRRQAAFMSEFVTAIDIIVRGVKAGLPFNDCMQIITTEVGEPVRSEFLNVVEQQRIGVPVEQAMQKLFERVPLQEVNFFCIVVTIQLSVGGNISEALSNLANVLRDRHKLKAKVQAVSTEAKASAAIIGALPLVVMGAVSFTNPDYMSLLYTHPTGHMILIGSALVMITGVFVMRWMINFKI
ncbi:MAG: type II secretion system F family protein [Rhizobiales bacterium]|nr:type II secretion system F family protein [Hyphomicrobiales bacterium]